MSRASAWRWRRRSARSRPNPRASPRSKPEPPGRVKTPEFPRWQEPEPAPEEDEEEPEPPPRRPAAPSRQDARGAVARKAAQPRYEETEDESEEEPAVAERPAAPRRPQTPRPDPRQDARPDPRADQRPPAVARKTADPRYVGGEASVAPAAAPNEPPRRPVRARGPGERQAGKRPPAERAPDQRGSLLNSGLRDFREVVSEASELGGAAARADALGARILCGGPGAAG